MIRERGIALIEVLTALVILAVAGSSAVAVLAAAFDDHAVMREREHHLVDASRVLGAAALLARSDLQLRLGRRQVGQFFVDVQRPERALFRIAASSVEAPSVEVLVTVVYRPESAGPPEEREPEEPEWGARP